MLCLTCLPFQVRTLSRMDSKGVLQSPDTLKKRGMMAAMFNKTSIDNLLHPRAAGATPYRVVLGDVRNWLSLNNRPSCLGILELRTSFCCYELEHWTTRQVGPVAHDVS